MARSGMAFLKLRLDLLLNLFDVGLTLLHNLADCCFSLFDFQILVLFKELLVLNSQMLRHGALSSV
jgi:hypothetical protein